MTVILIKKSLFLLCVVGVWGVGDRVREKERERERERERVERVILTLKTC